MQKLVIHPTSISQWYALLNDAQKHFNLKLPEETKSYLISLLIRFTDQPNFVNSIIAADFIRSCNSLGQLRHHRLQLVGDHCLLFAGLFPGIARRRRVRISYYANLGIGAYSSLAVSVKGRETAKLYAELGNSFVAMMDTLFAIREIDGNGQSLDLLQAKELWQDIGSIHAYKALRSQGNRSL